MELKIREDHLRNNITSQTYGGLVERYGKLTIVQELKNQDRQYSSIVGSISITFDWQCQ